jgi:hypothetical protein
MPAASRYEGDAACGRNVQARQQLLALPPRSSYMLCVHEAQARAVTDSGEQLRGTCLPMPL